MILECRLRPLPGPGLARAVEDVLKCAAAARRDGEDAMLAEGDRTAALDAAVAETPRIV